MKRTTLAALLLYLVGAIITFGHAAAFNATWREANCATRDQRLESPDNCYAASWGPALPAAMVWPLYWSWEAWS